MKTTSRWFSTRLHRDISMVRWGKFGQPVLVFPTAGGDAEEIERFLMLQVLAPLIDAGKIKVYSCDSVAGQAMVQKEGSAAHRQWLLNQFHQYVRHELVPAIRTDCNAENIELVAAGASIGAFHAAAVLCRFPDVFSTAIAMSGTFDIRRFMAAENFGDEFWVSSPLHFVPTLTGLHLEKLRTRFVLLASGEGKAEDINESWAMARVLGAKGIPNRVDSWGKQTPHDWVTWRDMLPKYLAHMVG
jgi:esterase/lipase superfamily enzyme